MKPGGNSSLGATAGAPALVGLLCIASPLPLPGAGLNAGAPALAGLLCIALPPVLLVRPGLNAGAPALAGSLCIASPPVLLLRPGLNAGAPALVGLLSTAYLPLRPGLVTIARPLGCATAIGRPQSPATGVLQGQFS